MISVITPTGDREIAFKLCLSWINQQTVKPDQWIVVDDGKREKFNIDSLPSFAQYVRREPQLTDHKFTLVENIKEAVKYIAGNQIFIMEDDEYYAPQYLEVMSKHLEPVAVVGIGCSKYYHLPTGGYEVHQNKEHASLAQTGFTDKFLPNFNSCIEKGMGTCWLDDQLWKAVQASQRSSAKIPFDLFVDNGSPLYVGMKGLPGRDGIGVGHKPQSYRGRVDDKNRTLLKQWIPLHYQKYLDVLEKIR